MKRTLTLMAVALMMGATTMAKELKIDADKTNAKKIVAALKKGGYEASVVSDGAPSEKKKVPVDATSGASQQKK